VCAGFNKTPTNNLQHHGCIPLNQYIDTGTE